MIEPEKNKNHYLDRKEFTKKLGDYGIECRLAKKNNLPKPKMSNSLAKDMILLVTNLARKSNFSGYTWREEMISDAIETICKYADRFDIKNSNNAFGYISRISWRCFLRRIAVEKKQHDTKVRYAQNLLSDDLNKKIDSSILDSDVDNSEFLNMISNYFSEKPVVIPNKKTRQTKKTIIDDLLKV